MNRNYNEAREELNRLEKKAEKLRRKYDKVLNQMHRIYEEFGPDNSVFDEELSYTYAKRDVKSAYKWSRDLVKNSLDWIAYREEKEFLNNVGEE